MHFKIIVRIVVNSSKQKYGNVDHYDMEWFYMKNKPWGHDTGSSPDPRYDRVKKLTFDIFILFSKY